MKITKKRYVGEWVIEGCEDCGHYKYHGENCSTGPYGMYCALGCFTGDHDSPGEHGTIPDNCKLEGA